jgi:hypothetical protein
VIRGIVLAFCMACAPRAQDLAESPDGGPQLLAVDSVTFEESDTAYVGRPMYLAMNDDGDFFISDAFSGRVLRFTRQGQLRQLYGRMGDGPGEFRGPHVLAFVGDSILLVDDVTARRTQFFQVATGAYLREHRDEGLVLSAVAHHDTIWMGMRNMERKTGVARWVVGSDSVIDMVAFPTEYLASPQLAAFSEIVRVVRWRDTLLVAYSAHNPLLLVTDNGARIDTVDMPAVRRRGVPPSIVQEFNGPIRNARRINISSAPFAIHRLANGGLALVYFDQEIHGTLLTATGYVSVIAPDWHRACIDRRLAFAPDAQPRVTFHGDTLFTLEQRVVGATRAVTFSRAFRLDTSHCHWQPIRRAQGA